MKDNDWNGRVKGYNADGKLIMEGELKNHKWNGRVKSYNSDGSCTVGIMRLGWFGYSDWFGIVKEYDADGKLIKYNEDKLDKKFLEMWKSEPKLNPEWN